MVDTFIPTDRDISYYVANGLPIPPGLLAKLRDQTTTVSDQDLTIAVQDGAPLTPELQTFLQSQGITVPPAGTVSGTPLGLPTTVPGATQPNYPYLGVDHARLNTNTGPTSITNFNALTGDQAGLAARINACQSLVVNQQCVSLASASVGIPMGSRTLGGHTIDWRAGDAATDGTLKVGAPIATFLKANGTQAKLYGDGTGGRMGANLDHAAVFQGYVVRDGKAVGIKVYEQYVGSGGTHSHIYMFGDPRGGEHDARNYFAIKTTDGNYLGGANNPMSHADPVVAANNPVNKTDKPAVAAAHDRPGRTAAPSMV